MESHNNPSGFQEERNNPSTDFEMASHDRYSLSEAQNELGNIKFKYEKLGLKEYKKKSLPIIQAYINCAQSVKELAETYGHLNWDKDFDFLKMRRHERLDSLFKSNPFHRKKDSQTEKQLDLNGTWAKIVELFLQKTAQLILSSKLNWSKKTDQEDFQNLITNLKQKVNKESDKYPLLATLDQMLKVLNDDANFKNTWGNFLEHHYSQLHFIIALQNIYAFTADCPTRDSLLEPLRFILAIIYKQKLAEPGPDIDQKIYKNSFKQINICIKQTKNIDELKRVFMYLQKDGFNFLNEESWDQFKISAQKHLNTIGTNYNIESIFSEMDEKNKPGPNINRKY